MAQSATLTRRRTQIDPGSDWIDRILVDRVVEGDSSAFDALMRRHYGQAIAAAVRYSGPSLAPDIVSSAFTKAFLAVRRFRGQCRFSTWLHRIVRNTAYDQNETLRKGELLGFDEGLSAVPATDRHGKPWTRDRCPDFDPETDAWAREEFRKAMSRLTRPDRELLELRYERDISYRQLAARSGVTLGTLKSRLHRARLHLRRSSRKTSFTDAWRGDRARPRWQGSRGAFAVC